MSDRQRWFAKQQALFRLYQANSTLLVITDHGVVVEIRIEADDRKHKATFTKLTRMTGSGVASHSADDGTDVAIESDLRLLLHTRNLNHHRLR